jgi:hypothetical protein
MIVTPRNTVNTSNTKDIRERERLVATSLTWRIEKDDAEGINTRKAITERITRVIKTLVLKPPLKVITDKLRILLNIHQQEVFLGIMNSLI